MKIFLLLILSTFLFFFKNIFGEISNNLVLEKAPDN